jgi:hypothetical protein
MHQRGLVALDKNGRPPVTTEQLFQLLALDAGEDGWVGNLVTVEMQDGQHRTVGGRIEKLVGMPRRGKRSGFRLAIADNAGGDEIGVV